METILITGANGQLGRELQLELKDSNYKVLCSDINETDIILDITNIDELNSFFENNKVDYIINCAAFTAVDAAEDNIELCTKLNYEGPKNLALCAKKHNIKLIHISTDYVFNGMNHKPYTENDEIFPLSVYGKTKVMGENKIMDIISNGIIIRTSWLYSPFGKNFVKTMLNLGNTKDNLNVVCDQVGTPTYARDLAHVIKLFIDNEIWYSGLYHFSNEGAISWYDFTKAIFEINNITTCKVLPCTSDEYITKATRPYYSILDKTKIKKTLNIEIPYWKDSLKECLNILKNK